MNVNYNNIQTTKKKLITETSPIKIPILKFKLLIKINLKVYCFPIFNNNVTSN